MVEQDEADVYEIWVQYYANGGNASKLEFESFLYGVSEPSALDLDLLELSIEELHAPKESAQPGH
ncbi:hypothetical protein [Arthrobacter sp. ZGTC412]|uniref:hypothetical protein n=1 Tax=Arthrobacter sp. ZGTC412 TaxID=2058900 RepID=UPI000CE53232|nr:hypothetical protein [Arthrobacter sp. ZGTC412]